MLKYKTAAAAFIILLAVSAAMLAAGNSGENNENRVMNTMPPLNRESVLSGEFAEGTDAYINDRIAFRSELIDLSQRITSYLGIKSPAGTIIRADMDMGTDARQSSDILVHDGEVSELFTMDTQTADTYADVLNAYAEAAEASGARMYSAIVPTRLEFDEPIYSNLEDSQLDAANYVYDRLDSGITALDMRSALAAHTDEYIYFNTDHHWTMLGAYYGYTALCEAAGITPVDISDYEKKSLPEFTGYLAGFVQDRTLLEKKDYVEWYDTDPENNIIGSMRAYEDDGNVKEYSSPMFYTAKEDYDFFLGADHPLAVYENSNADNDAAILVVADSFVNALTPWLTESYSRVILINPRSYGGTVKAACDEFEPDDVLVLDYTFVTSFYDYCMEMKRIAGME